ncbi:hypothetical protein LGAA44_240044 [Leuconostoc gasicomitatum]|nr:hypothetical protein LGAA44_240044 [Leuconostoc gasicomitatum]
MFLKDWSRWLLANWLHWPSIQLLIYVIELIVSIFRSFEMKRSNDSMFTRYKLQILYG